MQLFSRTDPDIAGLTLGRQSLRHIHQLHAGNFGNEYLSTVHILNTIHDKTNALFERDPETCHARIGNGDFAGLALLQKYWHYAAAATYDVAVTGTTKAC